MKIRTPRERRIEKLYANACTGFSANPAMFKMRGSLRSNILFIAPPPTPAEFEEGLPLSNSRALSFHEILEHIPFDTQGHALVVSCSLGGKKANKASTTPIVEFVKACARESLTTKFVCVGNEAYKFIFGEGKKYPMQTLAGAVIYHFMLSPYPLFVFPDIGALNPTFTGENRKDWVLGQMKEECENRIVAALPAFKKFLKL